MMNLNNAKHVRYTDRYFTGESLQAVCREQNSKVYGVKTFRVPSGWRTTVKVWNTRTNSMVQVDDRYIVEVID